MVEDLLPSLRVTFVGVQWVKASSEIALDRRYSPVVAEQMCLQKAELLEAMKYCTIYQVTQALAAVVFEGGYHMDFTCNTFIRQLGPGAGASNRLTLVRGEEEALR